MKLLSREEAREIGEKCKFKTGCGLCSYLGDDNPDMCCAFCVDFGTTECKGIVCLDLKVKEEHKEVKA